MCLVVIKCKAFSFTGFTWYTETYCVKCSRDRKEAFITTSLVWPCLRRTGWFKEQIWRVIREIRRWLSYLGKHVLLFFNAFKPLILVFCLVIRVLIFKCSIGSTKPLVVISVIFSFFRWRESNLFEFEY